MPNQINFNYPTHLPILKQKDNFARNFLENQVSIVVADTGSGKSTQVPKFCLEALGINNDDGTNANIIMVQPRRIGAISIATRIAEELKVNLGGLVGYKVRFSERLSPQTRLTVMTDGMLLSELQHNPNLSKYNVIIIDEAHERSLNIDILLGYMRLLLPKRSDLKLVISSATIDSQKFSQSFSNDNATANIIEAEGKLYPVEVIYQEPKESGEQALYDEILNITRYILDSESFGGGRGDILIFMSSEAEILSLIAEINKINSKRKILALPLYARLNSGEQKRIFEKFDGVKIIVSTNIAETTLTIDGIKFVIDSGFARISQYSNASRLQSLPISKISKASANQRKGRCGRLQDGVCYRVYSEDDFNSRADYTLPEILRSNLAETLLRLLSLKIYDVVNFPFIDKPSVALINEAYKTLFELKAIHDISHKKLTKDGYFMAKLPLDPRLSRILLTANSQNCLHDAIVVVSALALQDIRSFDKTEINKAKICHQVFTNKLSDFDFYLNLFKTLEEKQAISNGELKRFATANYLHLYRIKEWFLLYKQIKALFSDYGYKTDNSVFSSDTNKTTENNKFTAIHKSILSGYLTNFALLVKPDTKQNDYNQKQNKNAYPKKIEKPFYNLGGNKKAFIFPASSLVGQNHPIIFSAVVLKTSELFLRLNAKIELEWILELAPHLITKRHSLAYFSKKAGEALCTEKSYLQGLVLDDGVITSLKKYDKEKAFEFFIEEGLLINETNDELDDEVLERFKFLKHNKLCEEKAKEVEHKLRQGNIFIGNLALKNFYTQKLKNCYSYVDLDQYLRSLNGNESDLFINESDFFAKSIDISEDAYPSFYNQDDKKFSLSYQFSPSKETDGVSICLKQEDLYSLDLDKLSWQPLSLYNERIESLVKALPKEHRIKLQPMTATAVDIASNMVKSEKSLYVCLEEYVAKNYNTLIKASVWQTAEKSIFDYQRLSYTLLDNKGEIALHSKNLEDLKSYKIAPLHHNDLSHAKSDYLQTNLKGFPNTSLPISIELKSHGNKNIVIAYLAFCYKNGSINIEHFASLNEAETSHVKGVKELILLKWKKEINAIKNHLVWNNEPVEFAYFGGKTAFEKMWYDNFLSRNLELGWRSNEEFESCNSNFIKELWLCGEREHKASSEALKLYAKLRNLLASYNQKHSHLRPMFANILLLADRYFDSSIPFNGLVVEAMPRYLKSLTLRLERLVLNPAKDREKQELVNVYENLFKKINYSELPLSLKGEYKKGLLYLEEFKVKTFTSDIKSPIKIKDSDLDHLLKNIIF